MLIPLVVILTALGIDQVCKLNVPYIKIIIPLVGTSAFLISANIIQGYYHINNWAIVHAGLAVDQLTPPNALIIAPYEGDTAFLYQSNRRGWPIGFHIDKRIESGASYYVTVKYDDEARDLETKYKTIAKTEEYLILKLTGD
jgi:hypothetical protein